jgi:hypothetical protein
MAKCAVRRTPLRLRLWFYIVQGFKNTLQNFLIVINRFSLVKAAMNAPRICKLTSAQFVKNASISSFFDNIFQVSNKISSPLSNLVAISKTRRLSHTLKGS